MREYSAPCREEEGSVEREDNSVLGEAVEVLVADREEVVGILTSRVVRSAGALVHLNDTGCVAVHQ